MDVLLTYDITTRHGEVKAAMVNKGYADNWMASNQVYNLPNTTLWKKEISATIAVADMKQVIQTLNADQPFYNHIRLERCVAVNFDDSTSWAAIPGDARR